MASVTVSGVGAVPFGKHLDRTLSSLAEEAAGHALKDAGVDAEEIDAVFFSNALAGIVTGQECIRGQTALRGLRMLGKPIFNVENACASGSSAILLARNGLLSEMWRRVLVVGAEKMFHVDKTIPLRALAAAADLTDLPEEARTGRRPVFMELYAERTRQYMERTGATAEDFAAIAAKARRNAHYNPIAHYRSRVTKEEVLNSGEVASPLTRFMCSPISDGAAALILSRNEKDRSRSPIELVASQLLSGNPLSDDSPTACVSAAARNAYAEAGVGPEDIDVVELHDAAAPAELEYLEALGLCAEGEASALLRSGATELGGRLPVNTGGGLIARGHPVGATGIAQVREIVLQLRGEASNRQVETARVGLVQNAGGSVAGLAAASAVHILARR